MFLDARCIYEDFREGKEELGFVIARLKDGEMCMEISQVSDEVWIIIAGLLRCYGKLRTSFR